MKKKQISIFTEEGIQISEDDKKNIIREIRTMLDDILPTGILYEDYVDILSRLIRFETRGKVLHEFHAEDNKIFLGDDEIFSIEDITLMEKENATSKRNGARVVQFTIKY